MCEDTRPESKARAELWHRLYYGFAKWATSYGSDVATAVGRDCATRGQDDLIPVGDVAEAFKDPKNVALFAFRGWYLTYSPVENQWGYVAHSKEHTPDWCSFVCASLNEAPVYMHPAVEAARPKEPERAPEMASVGPLPDRLMVGAALERRLTQVSKDLAEMFRATGKQTCIVEAEMGVRVPKAGLLPEEDLPRQKGVTLEMIARFALVCGYEMDVTFKPLQARDADTDRYLKLVEEALKVSQIIWFLFPTPLQALIARQAVLGALDPHVVSTARPGESHIVLKWEQALSGLNFLHVKNPIWRGAAPDKLVLCGGVPMTDDIMKNTRAGQVVRFDPDGTEFSAKPERKPA